MPLPPPDCAGLAVALAPGSPSWTPRRNAAFALPTTQQGGSGNGAKADVARTTKV
ncbi:hypothetical protein BS78_10G243000 [Paspalum vaginatum]|nr:hypothetical protein BS78_10G243000 [Paspalum vaginatum]